MTAQLTAKEARRRDLILRAPLWKVILIITAPIALFNLLNYAYTVFDMIVLGGVSSSAINSIAFLDEIKNSISAFGTGIGIGGAVIVARHYGAGNLVDARRSAGVTLILAGLIAIGITLLTTIFAVPLLTLLKASPEIINDGLGYFNIQIITTTVVALNTVFIGLEKTKGNTLNIMIMNLIMTGVKVLLTLLFVVVLGKGLFEAAIATLLSQLVFTGYAAFRMFSKNNILKINMKDISLKKQYVVPILMISAPIVIGRFLFSFGKVIVNTMAEFYFPGTDTVGALSVASRTHSIGGTLALAFEESEIGIISQNIGNKNLKRATNTFFISTGFATIIAVLGILLTSIFSPQIISFFTREKPENFELAMQLFQWERFSALSSALIGITLGVFNGFKKSNVSFFVNFIRLIVLRIPVLMLFILVGNLGPIALGYTMFISNTGTTVICLILFTIFFIHLRNYGYQDIEFDLGKKVDTVEEASS